MKKDSRFLIGIFHADRMPWSQIVNEGQIPTWVNSSSDASEIIYCSGSHNSELTAMADRFLETLRWNRGAYVSNLRNLANLLIATPFSRIQPTMALKRQDCDENIARTFVTKFPDMYITTRWRRIALIKYFLESSDNEYLVTTTSSSYLNLGCLQREILATHKEVLYGGAVQYPGTIEEYAMGSFIVINRKAAKLFLENLDMYPLEMLDDIGLGKAAHALGMTATEFNSLAVTELDEVHALSENQLKSISHYKLKSGDLGNRKDVDLFHALHKQVLRLTEKRQ